MSITVCVEEEVCVCRAQNSFKVWIAGISQRNMSASDFCDVENITIVVRR